MNGGMKVTTVLEGKEVIVPVWLKSERMASDHRNTSDVPQSEPLVEQGMYETCHSAREEAAGWWFGSGKGISEF